MLIKSISLHNFRQFFGDNMLIFDTNSDKKVTVIIGDNTAGKTTLLQSFSWCLYGKINLDNPEDILNLEKKKELELNQIETVWVEISLIHKKRPYTIRREYTYNKKSNRPINKVLLVHYKDDDSNLKSIREDQVQNTINEILPSGLSHCFFFDSERISQITQRGKIASSVESLLGLESLVYATKHIGINSLKNSVLGLLQKDLIAENKEVLDKCRKDNDVLGNKIIRNVEIIKEHKNNLKETNKLIAEVRSNLINSTETQEKGKKLNDIETKIKQLENNIKNKESEHVKHFYKSYNTIVGKSIFSKVTNIVNSNNINQITNIISPEIINNLLSTKKCICGRPFQNHSMEYRELSKILNKSQENDIQNRKLHFINKLRKHVLLNSDEVKELKESYEEILIDRENLTNLELSQYDLQESLKNKPDYTVIMLNYEESLNSKNKLEEQIRSLEQENIETQKEIDKLENEIESLTINEIENKNTYNLINYANKISTEFNKILTEEKRIIRIVLESNVNDLFQLMYSGKRIVRINNNYEIELYYDDEIFDTDYEKHQSIESPGLTTVKNFAFIAGLVKTTIDRMKSDNNRNKDIMLLTEPFPLVMDAPFSNTDETHIKNISKQLPDIAEQLIIITMRKDWQIAKVIMPHTGNCYKLQKISDKHTKIIGDSNV